MHYKEDIGWGIALIVFIAIFSAFSIDAINRINNLPSYCDGLNRAECAEALYNKGTK